MPKIWKERRPQYRWKNSLTPTDVICVEVCGFTFYFNDVEHVSEVRDWFLKKTHKSTRLPDEPWLKCEHDAAQRWHERLPAHIKKGSKRQRVVKALNETINKYS